MTQVLGRGSTGVLYRHKKVLVKERRLASVGIGSVLKEERLHQNLNRDEISRRTCIAPRFIEAIEQDDFSRLPAIVFTRSFVRQYSQVLGLDPDPLLAALPKPDIEGAPLPVPQPGYGRGKWDPRVKSALQTALFVAAAIGAGTLAWARFNSGPEYGSYFSFDKWRVREVRLSPRQTASAPVPEALPATPPLTAAVEELAAPVEEKNPVVPVPLMAAKPVEVTVAAHEASWIQITADGKPLFSGILNPGAVRTAGASGRVKVLAGNAGGVDISLNGKKLDPLGPAGQVRSVTLTSDGPLPAEQTPPSSPAQPPSPDQL
jgi:cytoskeletal protein RodZ